MKVMVREVLRFMPGKMTEGTELLKESLALANKIGSEERSRR